MPSLTTPLMRVPFTLLAWLGSKGTAAVAFTLVAGTVMPHPIGEILKNYLTEAVALLLCIAFLRMDTTTLIGYSRKPALVLAALGWTSVMIPIIIGSTGLALGLAESSEALFLGLLLQAVASPIMSAPAIAALIGMESTLVLAALVVSTMLVPVTAPLFTSIFAGPALSISPLVLASKLFFILSGTFVVGMTLRRLLGQARIQRYQKPLDGLNIIILFVFAAAIMNEVMGQMITIPLTLLWVTGVGILVFTAILTGTVLVFSPAGWERAVTLGFMSSNRNMGLLLAATGTALPEITWMYLAMSQIPIYLAPHLLKHLTPKYHSSMRR